MASEESTCPALVSEAYAENPVASRYWEKTHRDLVHLKTESDAHNAMLNLESRGEIPHTPERVQQFFLNMSKPYSDLEWSAYVYGSSTRDRDPKSFRIWVGKEGVLTEVHIRSMNVFPDGCFVCFRGPNGRTFTLFAHLTNDPEENPNERKTRPHSVDHADITMAIGHHIHEPPSTHFRAWNVVEKGDVVTATSLYPSSMCPAEKQRRLYVDCI